MKKLIIPTIITSMILTGCATNDPNFNKTALGALGGAVGGAVISQATGGEHTGRDAAIGAMLGAGVGYYMEQQEAKLRQQTAGTGIEVKRDPVTNNINLSIPSAITFDVAQSDIKPAFYGTLSQVANTLKQYNRSSVIINGYASIEGNYEYNRSLSQARANSVANYIISQGVHAERVSAAGHGATSQFGASYEANRRVEITILAPR